VESEGKIDKNAELDDWLECRSDESSRSDYEYKYEEDPENMVVKKYKKNKNDIGAMGGGAPNMSIKEPFIYNERVAYGAADDDKVSPGDTVVFQLHDIACIVPFGVAAEQFICWQKNDIYNIVELSKAQNKKQKPSFGSASNTQDNSKDGKQ
jgi:hypothetical protein